MRRLVLVVCFSVSVVLIGCVSKAEIKTDAQAWRAEHDAVKPDLEKLYGSLPEPSRTTRLRVLRDGEAALQAFEARAGIAPVAS